MDPTILTINSVDGGWSVLANYGPIWGGMLLAYGLASTFLKNNAEHHWLAQGRKLAIIVVAVGSVGAALSSHFQGAPISGVVMTLVVGLFKLVQPTVNQ